MPSSLSLLSIALVQSALGLDNGVGLTPPMGYNTWNDLGCDNMNEANIRDIADSMVSTNLLVAGFDYLVLDDCWMASTRDAGGRLQGDSKRFSSGMASLASYVHSKGLKFGIYSDRGDQTCQGFPASLANEALDAQTFAEWGVDYLKHDNCHSSTGPNDQDQLFKEYGLMRDSLNATGRKIFYSVCGGGDNHPWSDITYYATDSRGAGKLANAWRISSDVVEWQTCQLAYNGNMNLAEFGGPGGFNDPDMLLGSSQSATRRMSAARSRTQFNMWAVQMAPLMIGANIRQLNAYDLETYTNAEVIAVNQDARMEQGRRVAYSSDNPFIQSISIAVWARELADSSVAMVFVNNYGDDRDVVCTSSCWANLPFAAGTRLEVRDLWNHSVAESGVAVVGSDYAVMVASDGASKMLRFVPIATLV